MKISIIIPMYNVAEYVSPCLESVAAQDWDGDMECIIVDDCCTDSSVEAVEKFVSAYSGKITFEILHHPSNRGLSAARNTGMSAASGDYLYFLDSDDVITSDCLRMLAAPLAEKEYDVVLGNHQVIGYQENGRYVDVPRINHMDDEGFTKAFARCRIISIACNRLFRTNFIRINGLSFLEGIVREDLLWWFELACLSPSVCLVPQITYIHKLREGSISTSLSGKLYQLGRDSFQMMMPEMISFAGRTGMLEDFWINYRIQHLFHIACVEYLDSSDDVFYDFYRALRRIPISVMTLLRADDLKIRCVVRDLHWFFPPRIGKSIFCHINIKWYSRWKKSI